MRATVSTAALLENEQESSMVNAAMTESSPDGLRSEARINPKTGKPAGPLQGGLLLAGSCLPVLGAVLLAPDLPTMSRVFAAVPGANALVPLVLTVPALFIALLAPFAGAIVDKLGRKRVLIVALFVYAVLGTAPLWIGTLGGILASRIGVGITEAFIITCCTTLIADYFSGGRRNRYLGLQALVTALAATVFFAIGGALGGLGWRAPFWVYAISVVVAILMIVVIWPTRQKADGAEQSIEKLPRLNFRPLVAPVIVTLFGGVVFYTLIVELSYVLNAHGVTATGAIGLATAAASLATAIGAFLFRSIARLGTRMLLTAAFAIAGAGMLIVASAPAVPLVVIGAIVASFGTGVLLPTLITWAISRLPYEQRGRGTGAWTASLFFGEFICPLAVVGLTGAAGTLSAAIAIVGIVSLIIGIVVALSVRSPRTGEVVA
jgi:MFS family permease